MKRVRHTTLALALLAVACGEPEARLDAVDTSVLGPAVQRQIEEAIEASRAAPDDAEAQGELARILHAYQLFEPAAAAYRRAVELDPESFRWRYYLARAVGSAGRNEEARTLLEEALAINPSYSPARVIFGDLLLESGDARGACDFYREAAELDPLSARATYGMAKCSKALGDRQAAIASFQKTLELAPGFGAAHYSLGQLYRDLGDSERAAYHLERAVRFQRNKAAARDTLMAAVVGLAGGASDLTKAAIELHGEGDVDGATKKLNEAIELDPEYVPARVNLIKIHGDAGRYKLAEEHYRAAIAVSPNAQQARFNYARTLIQQQRLPEAQTELQRVVEINPHLADAQVLLGSLLEEGGRTDEAVHHYEQAVASKPAHPQANLMLARHRLLAGRVEEADLHAERLLAADTRSLAILVYRLGLFYEQAGLRPRARHYLLHARRLADEAGRARLVQEIDSRMAGWS